MSYLLTTYSNGRVWGVGKFDDQYDATKAANDAMNSHPYDADEYEITTEVGDNKSYIVAYGFNEDRALENMKADEVVA
jgi:hypothetical protein